MADIEAQKIVWLWPDRIPTKLVVWAGNPGFGKSQTTIAIAATVTTGGNWPDNTACQRGSVIFICGEDDPADTIKPRLEAASADTSKVHVIDATINTNGHHQQWLLENGVEPLERLCRRIGDVRLIVIDPITAYIGKKDGHNTSDVRGLLAPLMEIADKYKFCVIAVTHLNKATGNDAVTRVTGSGAYVAAARAAFIVGNHPTEADAYCIATLKTNLSPNKTGIGYKIVSVTNPDGIATSRVEWMPGVIDIDADQLLAPVKQSEDIDANSAKGDAAAFLIDALVDGPVLSNKIYKAAQDAGIADRTLKRAKSALMIRSIKVDGERGWHMTLPNRSEECQQHTPLALGTLGTLGTLDGEECQEGQQCHSARVGKVGILETSTVSIHEQTQRNIANPPVTAVSNGASS